MLINNGKLSIEGSVGMVSVKVSVSGIDFCTTSVALKQQNIISGISFLIVLLRYGKS